MEDNKKDELVTYEYGAMSNKFSLVAADKRTAYATMCVHFGSSNHLVAIYSPESSKKDSWLSLDGKISERLDEIFGGKDSFEEYLENHHLEVAKCYDSITRIV